MTHAEIYTFYTNTSQVFLTKHINI